MGNWTDVLSTCLAASAASTLGLERTGGFETVAFCEIDPFCPPRAGEALALEFPAIDVRASPQTALLPMELPSMSSAAGSPARTSPSLGARSGH
jgi:hypothetical protein